MKAIKGGGKKIFGPALFVVCLLALSMPAHASVNVNPASISFGSVAVGTVSTSVYVTLTNNGSWNANFTGAALSSAQFSYAGPTGAFTLKPYQRLRVAVAFLPAAAQTYGGTLTFTRSNGSKITIPLAGTGIDIGTQSPTITSQPASSTMIAGQTASFSVVAAGTAPLNYQWSRNGVAITGATSSSYTTPATATSDSGAQLTCVVSNSAGSVTSNSATLTVNTVTGPFTIWPSSAVPTVIDQGPDSPVELGVTFHSDINGYITGIRFYKSTANTGIHVGNLWSSTGALLAKATFSGESTSGWQQVNFANPVAITANTNYVASYHTNSGHYSIDENYFATSGVDRAPLHAMANGNGGLNGPYAYGSSSAFPKLTYKSTNYWVDMVFSPAANQAPVAPSITTQPASRTVTAGQTASFSGSVSGTAPFTYQWKKNGTAISGATSSTYTTPATTTSDTGAQFAVVATNSVGSVASNAAVLTVNAGTLLLTVSPTSLSFGNVNLSASATQSATITNSGTGSVTISGVSYSGAGFTTSGLSSGLILSPGRAATLNVSFSPTAAGNVTGSIAVASNASNSPGTVSVSGSGVQLITHRANLSWIPSTSSVVGYQIYSSTVPGGPYTRLTSSAVTLFSYTDSTVQSGNTYYYVATAVDSTSVESVYSNQASAVIP